MSSATPGRTAACRFLEIDEELWDWVLDTDLKGPFLVAQAAARQMVRNGTGGSIIATSSVSAWSAQPELVHYQAAKAGVEMLVRGMALELAPHGIRVNAIAPGLVETNLTTRIFQHAGTARRPRQPHPLGRAGSRRTSSAPPSSSPRTSPHG